MRSSDDIRAVKRLSWREWLLNGLGDAVTDPIPGPIQWQRDRLLFLMAELCITAYGDKRRSVLKAEIRKMRDEIGNPPALELP